MTASPLLTAILPIALGIIMLGLGLSLTLADFTRVVKYPRPVIIGLACQIVLLPLVCFLIANGFGLESALAVGLMLLAASRAGPRPTCSVIWPTAMWREHHPHGGQLADRHPDHAAAGESVAGLVHGLGPGPLQFAKVMQVFAIVLLPVALGMLIRRAAPTFAARMEKPMKLVAALFLAFTIALALARTGRPSSSTRRWSVARRCCSTC